MSSYAEDKREAKKHRIFFSSAGFDEYTSNDVPEDHKDKFRDIQTLGHTRFHDYGFTPDPLSSAKPWIYERKKRANMISELASKCRRERRNEDGWRFEIESRLFDRFDYEVAW